MSGSKRGRKSGAWEGRTRTSAKVGVPVVVDGYAVPKRVTFELEGTDGRAGNASPDVTAHFEVRDGVPECVEISVRAKPAGRAVRSVDLALFNIENLTKRVFAEHATAIDGGARPLSGETARRAANAIADRVEGPRPTPEAELEAVARVYLTHRPTGSAAVRDLLDYPARTAYRRVEQAREAGLIPSREASEQAYADALTALEQPQPAPAQSALPIEDMNRWLGWPDEKETQS